MKNLLDKKLTQHSGYFINRKKLWQEIFYYLALKEKFSIQQFKTKLHEKHLISGGLIYRKYSS